MRAHFLLAVVFVLVAFRASAGVQDSRSVNSSAWIIPSDEDIRKLLSDRIDVNHQGVGIVVGVIEPRGRRVIAYGKGATGSSRPLDGDSVFQIGSVTKVFTTLILADMVKRGELDLDDPVSRYLSGVRLPELGRPITLRDLAMHTSGLPSMPTNFVLTSRPNPYETYSVDQLYRFLTDYQLAREPGEKSEYSNLGVSLLGHLLARRAAVDYETLVRTRVLKPLGMDSTSITLTPDQSRRLAIGHDMYLRPVEQWNLPNLPGSGALRSTANDMLKFLAANLGYESGPIISAMVFQREVRKPVSGTVQQALGWQIGRVGNEEIVAHDGGKPGYRAYAAFNPRTRTGIVILANARSDDRLSNLALHLLTGRPLRPTPTAPEVRRVVSLSRKELDAFAGRYQLSPDVVLTLVRKESHLLMDTTGDGISEFFPEKPTEFFSNTDNVQIRFEVAPSGSIEGLVLHQNGKDERATRIHR